jgi:adenine-specific DNA-methyltransferase
LDIKNRRYIGNKNKLLGFISNSIEKEGLIFDSVADLFAGTGVVSEYFLKKGKNVLINDFLYSNFIFYNTWFSKEKFDYAKIKKIMEELNKLNPAHLIDNYFSINFGGNYYHLNDAKKIGEIREQIEILYLKNKINKREYYILLTSLMYTADKAANTVGHYEMFLSSPPKEKKIFLCMPNISEYKGHVKIFKEDANILSKKIKADLVYIDPPYNARQYANFYHLLENLANWKKPEVFDKGRKMKRKEIMSEYSRCNAKEVFENLINSLRAKYIVVSYNNTYNAKSTASNNLISFGEIKNILNKVGKINIYKKNYKYFNSGKTNFKRHKEYLFICHTKDRTLHKGSQSKSLITINPTTQSQY